MRTRYVLLLAAAAAAFAASGCGHSSQTPAEPSAVVQPTPAPTPLVCEPTPPPLYGIRVKVHQDFGPRKTLDSRPVVINGDGYCGKAGFGESDHFCFTRREGDPQAAACDMMAVGRATDTGRYGPTWRYEGQPCTEPTEIGCNNHPDNQFLVIAKGDGELAACAAPEIPLSQDPSRPGARCGTCRVSAASSECQ